VNPQIELDELYREVILDHAKKPRNHGVLPTATHHAEGVNPVCGDAVQLDLEVADGTLKRIRFAGQGCSISQASASMLTEHVQGLAVAEALERADAFRTFMMGSDEPYEALGDLEIMAGVRRFPVRVKCALLSWNVLRDALQPIVHSEE
jgi:nitrogen fixation NifU-like protein